MQQPLHQCAPLAEWLEDTTARYIFPINVPKDAAFMLVSPMSATIQEILIQIAFVVSILNLLVM